MRVGAIGVVQARPRGLRGHASATREAHKGRCGYKGSGALAVTKVGRHSPTPSVQAAEQRAFARSERRRGVREGTGGAGRRAAAWRGRPASPIPALTLQGAGVDGSVTSAGGTGGQPKGSARSEMPGRWRARVLSWMGSSSRRGPQFRQARSETCVKRACGATAWGRGRTSCVQAAQPARRPVFSAPTEAQYSGALRHCTLTPLHPWRGAGGLRLAGLFFPLLRPPLYRGHSTVGHYAIARLHPYTPAGRFEPSLARDFFFLSSRPLQGAQYSGALRHCTLTPLHPCALFS
jgi:hypothetical protein